MNTKAIGRVCPWTIVTNLVMRHSYQNFVEFISKQREQKKIGKKRERERGPFGIIFII